MRIQFAIAYNLSETNESKSRDYPWIVTFGFKIFRSLLNFRILIIFVYNSSLIDQTVRGKLHEFEAPELIFYLTILTAISVTIVSISFKNDCTSEERRRRVTLR